MKDVINKKFQSLNQHSIKKTIESAIHEVRNSLSQGWTRFKRSNRAEIVRTNMALLNDYEEIMITSLRCGP